MSALIWHRMQYRQKLAITCSFMFWLLYSLKYKLSVWPGEEAWCGSCASLGLVRVKTAPVCSRNHTPVVQPMCSRFAESVVWGVLIVWIVSLYGVPKCRKLNIVSEAASVPLPSWKGGKAGIHLGPLHWTSVNLSVTRVISAFMMCVSEMFCQQEIIEMFTLKIVQVVLKTLNEDRNEVKIHTIKWNHEPNLHNTYFGETQK
jgi:hypothetical protein